MKTSSVVSIFIAGVMVLLVSLGLMYASVFFFSGMMDEYYEPVFRSSSFSTDVLFYIHPFILSAALFWFWNRSKELLHGSAISKAAKESVVYGLVSLLPVLLLTFSAINISAFMVVTWIGYGIVQAFVAFLVFANRNK